MIAYIPPSPDLSACVYNIECNSLFDFTPPNDGDVNSLSAGDREIATIREFGDNFIKNNPALTHATTDDDTLSEYRRSNVGWFNPNDAEHGWLIKKLSDNIAYFNALHWNFDLTGFVEPCQYTVYTAEQLGHYNWHIDMTNKWNRSPRKLSVVVQLSDPDEYEGGEFCIKTHETETVLSKKKGNLIIFPSYVLHKVNPVTKGVRRSLVCWIAGPKLR